MSQIFALIFRSKWFDFFSQGSNMYFYTGPGGATNDSPINSDDDEETVKVRKWHKMTMNHEIVER